MTRHLEALGEGERSSEKQPFKGPDYATPNHEISHPPYGGFEMTYLAAVQHKLRTRARHPDALVRERGISGKEAVQSVYATPDHEISHPPYGGFEMTYLAAVQHKLRTRARHPDALVRERGISGKEAVQSVYATPDHEISHPPLTGDSK